MTSADHLEPYALRLRLAPVSGSIERPQELTADLLEEIGRVCLAGGASVIGHVKCHVRAESAEGRESRFHANLTSMRAGARLGGEAVSPATAMRMDLVVLVYGMDLADLEKAVAGALDSATRRAGATWTRQPSQAGEHHAHEGHHH